ncbi:unnamed protein product [Triticum turgidum subsp. durum]|uniref:NAD-dependent epimerase/dehydratase domain-containing protein n=1 Tax=Triticum turgidum subsp. durum TaxID=4567 RepID=A0A9R0ZN03_TRITD|nr:unnamed protein product [Triticum turgidum subsp. durum]
MAEEGNSSGGRGVRVCVTGGAGFIGSWLVRKLLEAGYTVHATLRSIRDEGKAGLLRRLVPGAAPPERLVGLLRRLVPGGGPPEQLVLFEADLFDAASFAPAIAGCQFVFLVANPSAHEAADSKYKTSAEAAADGVCVILRLCAQSKTVKRVIHTASVTAASPLTKSSSAATAVYSDFISESCWTLLDVDYPLRSVHFDVQNDNLSGNIIIVTVLGAHLQKYIESKVLSEKELLSYNDGESPAFEVVTLSLGLVGGDTVLSHLPETVESMVAPVTKQDPYFMLPRILQRLLGSVPLVHVDDVCAALIFCMEQPSISGRFLCAAAYPTTLDILDHYSSKYPHLEVLRETDEVARVHPERSKLWELGFRYKYGVEEILDESIDCAVRLGSLDASKLIVQQE